MDRRRSGAGSEPDGADRAVGPAEPVLHVSAAARFQRPTTTATTTAIGVRLGWSASSAAVGSATTPASATTARSAMGSTRICPTCSDPLWIRRSDGSEA